MDTIKLYKVLKTQFPFDTVDVTESEDYTLNIVIISRQFENMDLSERRDLVRRVTRLGGFTVQDRTEHSKLAFFTPQEILESTEP
jgi:hypothetical protein